MSVRTGRDHRNRLLPGALLTASATALVGLGAVGAVAAPAPQSAVPRQAASPQAVPQQAASRGAAPATRWCDTGSLRLHIRPLNPGAGQRYAAVVLSNSSSTPCVTKGYVGLRLIRSGTSVPTRVVPDRSVAAERIVLRPGGRAWALLHWSAVAGRGDSDGFDCQPPARRVQVTPPDTYRQLVAAWNYGPVCQRGRIDVRPLAKGGGPAY